MPSNHLILYCPLLLLPSIFPSNRVFSNESVLCIRWPKYWSFNFSISPSNEYSGLISFTMEWLELLAVQGTLKSLLQHHSSKASILQHSALIIAQLSHDYWKNRWRYSGTNPGHGVSDDLPGDTCVTTGWMIWGVLCSFTRRGLLTSSHNFNGIKCSSVVAV